MRAIGTAPLAPKRTTGDRHPTGSDAFSPQTRRKRSRTTTKILRHLQLIHINLTSNYFDFQTDTTRYLLAHRDALRYRPGWKFHIADCPRDYERIFNAR